MSHHPACQSRNAMTRRISSCSNSTSSSQRRARARALHHSTRSDSCSPSSLLLEPEVFQIHDIFCCPTVRPSLCLSGTTSFCLSSGLRLLSHSSFLPSLDARFRSAPLELEYLTDKASMRCSVLVMIPLAWVFARCPRMNVSLYLYRWYHRLSTVWRSLSVSYA